MTSAGFVVLLCILAPGITAFPRMLRDGLNPVLAIGLALILCALWTVVIGVTLMVTRFGMIPGIYWVILLTAVVVTEIRRVRPAKRLPPNDNYKGFKK